MKELSRSSSPREELLEDEPLKDGFLQETQLDNFSFEYGLPSETLPKDLSSEDNFLKETQLDNFSFEYGLPSETLPKDLSSEDNFLKETQIEDLSLEDNFSGERLSNEDWSDEEEDSETAHIGHTIKSSLRAAIEWCDEVANTQDDFITNFKSHLPFVVVLGLIILLLWALRIFYG